MRLKKNIIFSDCEEVRFDGLRKILCNYSLNKRIKNTQANEIFFDSIKSIDFINSKLNDYLPIIEGRLSKIVSISDQKVLKQLIFFYIKDLLSLSYYYFSYIEAIYDSNTHVLKIAEKPELPPLIGIHGLSDPMYWHIFSSGIEYFVGEYFRLFYPGRCVELKIKQVLTKANYKNDIKNNSKALDFNRVLNKIYSFLTKICTKRLKIIIVNVPTSREKKFKLFFGSLGRIAVMDAIHHSGDISNSKLSSHLNVEARRIISEPLIDKNDRFEQFFRKCLENSFPRSLLEDLSVYLEFHESAWSKYKNLNTIISEVQYQDSSIPLAAAILKGVEILPMPHFYPLEIYYSHNLNKLLLNQYPLIQRGQFSSGRVQSKIKGSLFNYKVKLQQKTIPILYISTDFYKNFLPHEHSSSGNGYDVSLEYFRFVDTLFSALSFDVRDRLFIKRRPDHICNPIRLSYHQNLKILDKNVSAREYIGAAELVLIEGMSTSFFEAMASNIPTISFWPDIYSFDVDYVGYWQPLMDADIVFNDPLKLASHLNSIKENPLNWWGCERVQNAISNFKKMHFYCEGEFEHSILEYLRALDV